MRVFIAGMDGYLGWALAQHLVERGHQIAGADNLLRRRCVEEMGSWSAIPISPIQDRLAQFRERFGYAVPFWEGDLREYPLVDRIFREFRPEAIVHFGESPSAPYSMIDVNHAVFVQMNNLTTTFNLLFAMKEVCPEAHLVKLGTMGEYGTPDVDIPEGFFEVEYRGRRDRLPFPRQAGSWYHLSKVHGSNNIAFACKIWGLSATDIMQGVVYGTRIDAMDGHEAMQTRLDFDQAFGTAINRFCCQAVIDHPLTLFGRGHQKRGFLPLRDSMQCLTLALENPPQPGEYRVFNQFEDVYDLTELALKVQGAAAEMGIKARIVNLENPRLEKEEHHYCPERRHLLDLGYVPTSDMDSELRTMLADLVAHRDRVNERANVLVPDVRWDGTRARVQPLDIVPAGQDQLALRSAVA